MIRRLLSLLAVVLFVFLAVDIVQGFSDVTKGNESNLIAVDVGEEGHLARFEMSGLPAYASLTGKSGAYLLAGADHDGMAKLRSLGLNYTVLVEDIDGGSYYVVLPAPGRPSPRWQDYGELLLDDGLQVLLHTNGAKADRLAQKGAVIQKLRFAPIVLRPNNPSVRVPSLLDPDPTIQSMMDQVISTTVHQYDGDLSGEWPVIVDGQPYTIATRYTYSGEPIEKATEYVAEHMGNLGLDIEYHVWNASRPPNIIGEMTGETNPDDIFLITAHIDDTAYDTDPYVLAPGADDNASGSTAVMIASDIFSQYRWGCTLRFAFFTGEEQGLLGSYAYADRSAAAGENIVGVLNLDMIAWNTPGSSRVIDLKANSFPGSIAIAELFEDVIDVYNVDLIPQISTSGSGGSDHVPFWSNGYDAILGIEDTSHDFNPYYHSSNDLLENMDLDYFTDFVRASIGTYAHMTGCMIGSETGYVDGNVTEANQGPPIEGAEVVMVSGTGAEAYATTDGSGYYTTTADIGTYTVTVSALHYIPAMVSGVEVLTDTVTTVDVSLVRVSQGAIDGHVSDAESGAVVADASVYLEDASGWNTTVTTDDAGYYTATVDIGTYTVTVSALDFYPMTVDSVEIYASTVTTMDFELIRENYYLYLAAILRGS